MFVTSLLQVHYLWELSDNHRAGWVRTTEAILGEKPTANNWHCFRIDREELPILSCETIRVRLDSIELRRPRE